MKRSRKSELKRGRYDLAIRSGRPRVRLAQPVDDRAPAPEDARLLAELAWLARLRDGCVPKGQAPPSPRP